MRLGDWSLEASSFSFDPHDLWIGAYWKRSEIGVASPDLWGRGKLEGDYRPLGGTVVSKLEVYVCLLPMLPIRLLFVRRRSIPKHSVTRGARGDSVTPTLGKEEL